MHGPFGCRPRLGTPENESYASLKGSINLKGSIRAPIGGSLKGSIRAPIGGSLKGTYKGSFSVSEGLAVHSFGIRALGLSTRTLAQGRHGIQRPRLLQGHAQQTQQRAVCANEAGSKQR